MQHLLEIVVLTSCAGFETVSTFISLIKKLDKEGYKS